MSKNLFSLFTYYFTIARKRCQDNSAFFLVGRDGVEPSQSQTADLQSVGLTKMLSLPSFFSSIISRFEGKSQAFI